tara:strand:+ start:392 stop:781 length:390 start_codon:yes stop_codon:yes gene_type:complete
MKKSLLLAALLLPCAAQADVYFCTSLQYAEAHLKNTITISDQEFDGDNYDRDTFSAIVDTEKGVSTPNYNLYKGGCIQDDKFVKCENEDELFDTFDRLVINKEKRTFTEIHQDYNSAVGFSISGTCVKA